MTTEKMLLNVIKTNAGWLLDSNMRETDLDLIYIENETLYISVIYFLIS